MKAISVRQPWASLVVKGAKCLEISDFSLESGEEVLVYAEPIDANDPCLKNNEYVNWFIDDCEDLPEDCIIGKLTILRTDPAEKLIYAKVWPEAFTTRQEKEIEFSFNDFKKGNFAWTLSQPVEFEVPLPRNFATGFWNSNFKNEKNTPEHIMV